MKNFFNKLVCNWVVLAVVLGIALGGGFSGLADAALGKAKFVGFMGLDYSSDLGNATGATTAVEVLEHLIYVLVER